MLPYAGSQVTLASGAMSLRTALRNAVQKAPTHTILYPERRKPFPSRPHAAEPPPVQAVPPRPTPATIPDGVRRNRRRRVRDTAPTPIMYRGTPVDYSGFTFPKRKKLKPTHIATSATAATNIAPIPSTQVPERPKTSETSKGSCSSDPSR